MVNQGLKFRARREAKPKVSQRQIEERLELPWGFLTAIERISAPFEPSRRQWLRLYAVLDEIRAEQSKETPAA